MILQELLKEESDEEALRLSLETVPYAAYLGMEAKVNGDSILFVLPENSDLIGNPTLPAIHGGVVAAFMEQSATSHLMIKMTDPVLPKVVDFSIDYLRPTRLKDTFARCELTRLGRQVARIGITAWQEDFDQPCAVARAHFMLSD